MTQPDEDDVLRALRRLAAVEPSAAATDRAVADTRAALVALRRRKQMRRRLVVTLGCAAALFVVLGGWWLLGREDAALAQLREQVARTKSLSMTVTTITPDGTDTVRVWALDDGRLRSEHDNGYSVVDPVRQRALLVDTKDKRATRMTGYYHRGPKNLYTLLRDLPERGVKKLPDREIDGKRALGYVAVLDVGEPKIELTVWADPESKLPRRIEGKAEADGKQITWTAEQLVFDRPYDEKAFALDPPEGFTVVEAKGLDTPPAGALPQAEAFRIRPGEGVGPVRFGMKREEVEKLLGKPDFVEGRGMSLAYHRHGLGLLVSPVRGVMLIHCNTQATFIVRVNDFAGKTAEGIGMGSTREEVEKALGKPGKTEGDAATRRLYYPEKGLEFTLFRDKVVQLALSPTKQP